MAELRDRCADLGWEDVQTYIQSGNIVFRATGKRPALEAALEAALQEQFGFTVPVLVRTAADWAGFVKDNPFPDAAKTDAAFVHLALSKGSPAKDAAEKLLERAKDGEKVMRVGEALYVHYPNGAGRSKLTPALFDRFAGSPVTARNWNTVLKLHEMVSG